MIILISKPWRKQHMYFQKSWFWYFGSESLALIFFASNEAYWEQAVWSITKKNLVLFKAKCKSEKHFVGFVIKPSNVKNIKVCNWKLRDVSLMLVTEWWNINSKQYWKHEQKWWHKMIKGQNTFIFKHIKISHSVQCTPTSLRRRANITFHNNCQRSL